MALIAKPAGLHVKELPGLAAWWDFGDVRTYGSGAASNLASIADKSGGGYSLFVQAGITAPIAVRKSPTGRNALDGASSGTGLGLKGNSPAILTVSAGELLVCYAAMYPSATGGGHRVVANDPAGGNWLMGPYSNNWAMYNGAGFIGSPGAYPVGNWVVHTGVVSASQNLTYHHGNGVLLGSASGTGYPGASGIALGLSFGEDPKVFLGEVLILKTSAESVRLSVQDYLMRKWGAGGSLAQGRLLRAQVQRKFFATSAGGSSVTVSLTQQAGVGTVGSLTSSRSVAQTQVAGTGTVGAIAAARAAALSQAAGIGTTGTLSEAAAIGLTQQAATGAVGTVTASTASSVTVALTQVSATGTTGSTAPAQALTLAQDAAVGVAGTITPTRAATLAQTAATGTVGALSPSRAIALTQASGTSSVGVVAPARTTPLTQAAGSGAVGTVAPAASVVLAEAAATGTIGSLTATAGSNVTVTLTQQVATGTAGTVAPSTRVAPSQAAAVGAIGALARSGSVGVGQVSATGTVGIITVGSGVTVALTQAAAVGAVGTVAWATALGLSHTLGLGVAGTITVGGIIQPDPRRTIASIVGSRSLASVARSRSIASAIGSRSVGS